MLVSAQVLASRLWTRPRARADARSGDGLSRISPPRRHSLYLGSKAKPVGIKSASDIRSSADPLARASGQKRVKPRQKRPERAAKLIAGLRSSAATHKARGEDDLLRRQFSEIPLPSAKSRKVPLLQAARSSRRPWHRVPSNARGCSAESRSNMISGMRAADRSQASLPEMGSAGQLFLTCHVR